MLSSMDKMWASFVGIGLMVAASLLITFARTRPRGVLRLVLTIAAFLALIVGVLYMLVSMS